MIDSLQELITSLNEQWLEQAQPDMDTLRVRVLRNNGDHVTGYMIESVEFDEGIMEIWLNDKNSS